MQINASEISPSMLALHGTIQVKIGQITLSLNYCHSSFFSNVCSKTLVINATALTGVLSVLRIIPQNERLLGCFFCLFCF